MGKYESIRLVEAEEGQAFDLKVPKGQDKDDYDPYSEAIIIQNKVIIGLLKNVNGNLKELISNRTNALELTSNYFPEFLKELKYYLNLSTHENIEGKPKDLNPVKELSEKPKQKPKTQSKPKPKPESKKEPKPKRETPNADMDKETKNGNECTWIHHFQYVRETGKAVCLGVAGETYWFPKSAVHSEIESKEGKEQKVLVEDWVLRKKEIL